ncbi:MAG: TlpA family protein disulfide reductase [Dysgonamonadaceae bacterium]|jgi:thiol-disulfide isomerase/thioredoxin|nr:TlpA family protein disulfide reductase [Dysgonamonadaceae bacterium]
MNKIRHLLFFLLFIFNVIPNFSRNKVIQLELNGKKYDYLYIQIKHLFKEKTKIDGKSIDGCKWIFSVPDSIAQEACFIEFRYKQSNDKIEDLRALGFLGVINGDTLKNYYVNFDNTGDTILLHGNFSKIETHTSLSSFENDSSGIGNWYRDFFIVNPQENKYLMERMQSPFFSFFKNFNDNNINYKDYINEYIQKIRENPDSKYYITNLASTLSFYLSTQDIEELYSFFSPTIKNSYFGREVYRYFLSKNLYLNSKFENSILPSWDTGNLEPIIQDTLKYNLVIFSASWCGPCIKEIPLLKEVYSDLQENLPMTYISIDELKTVKAWGKLMRKENIPWRSLLATNEIDKIKKKYFVEGIPHTLLVYPDKRIEILDIRIKEKKEKLYVLAGKK